MLEFGFGWLFWMFSFGLGHIWPTEGPCNFNGVPCR